MFLSHFKKVAGRSTYQHNYEIGLANARARLARLEAEVIEARNSIARMEDTSKSLDRVPYKPQLLEIASYFCLLGEDGEPDLSEAQHHGYSVTLRTFESALDDARSLEWLVDNRVTPAAITALTPWALQREKLKPRPARRIPGQDEQVACASYLVSCAEQRRSPSTQEARDLGFKVKDSLPRALSSALAEGWVTQDGAGVLTPAVGFDQLKKYAEKK